MFLLSIQSVNAQCVVFNEVMVNAAGNCDGGCNPNTSEWTELYNTCNYPVNLSCYVLTDGDFTVTFPQGTTIGANGYLIIGSNNSGGAVNINIATCNCAAGNTIGTFTNPNEQIVLVNTAGVIQDAIVWGGGQFPLNITSTSAGGCTPITINEPTSANFTNVPVSADGCTVARTCDGSATWEARCGTAISMGTTNGLANIPSYTVSDTVICPGTCINFTDNSSGNPTAWQWTFSGAVTATSTIQNPVFICYSTPGNYTVALQVTNACGTNSLSHINNIHVNPGAAPAVSANGPLSFCTGNSVTLSTSSSGTYQWLLNGNILSGETSSSIIASVSGNYSVQVASGSCSGTSTDMQVTNIPPPLVNAGPDVTSNCFNGVTLSGSGEGTPSWLPSLGLNQTTVFQPTANPIVNTTYYLTADNGVCKSIDSVNVFVNCFTISVPNVFTPNNDGINDKFYLTLSGFYSFKIRIYNRWGENLFQTTDINNSWDGTYMGKKVPEGVYFWQLEVNDINGKSLLTNEQKKGFLELLR